MSLLISFHMRSVVNKYFGILDFARILCLILTKTFEVISFPVLQSSSAHFLTLPPSCLSKNLKLPCLSSVLLTQESLRVPTHYMSSSCCWLAWKLKKPLVFMFQVGLFWLPPGLPWWLSRSVSFQSESDWTELNWTEAFISHGSNEAMEVCCEN